MEQAFISNALQFAAQGDPRARRYFGIQNLSPDDFHANLTDYLHVAIRAIKLYADSVSDNEQAQQIAQKLISDYENELVILNNSE